MSLDLCPLGLDDEDIVSSTPRCPPGRSQSEDGRRLIAHNYSQQQHFQHHNKHHHQHPNNYHHQERHPEQRDEEPSMELITQTVQVDVHCSKSPRDNTPDNDDVFKEDQTDALGDKVWSNFENKSEIEIGPTEERELRNGLNDKEGSVLENMNVETGNTRLTDNAIHWKHQSEITPAVHGSSSPERHGSPVRRHHSQPRTQTSFHPYTYNQSSPLEIVQHHQPRIYRPRVVQQTQHAHHHMVAFHPKRSLARYMNSGHSSATPSALPSRGVMVYSSTPLVSGGEHDRGRSRSKKKSSTHSASVASKMRQLRNRSQSPHSIQLQNSQSQGREFLRAIQNSVERRQRAHRLSLYQLPDQDDDAWNIG